MFRPIAVLALTVGMNAVPSDAPKKSCTKSEAMQAEKEVDSLKDWDDIHRSYKRFSQCDDGAIAEGFSDAVGKLLANNWGQVGRLVTLAKTDKNFERFVVKHVDESLPAGTLQKISNNARSSCPEGGRVAQAFDLASITNTVGAPLLRSLQGRVTRTPAAAKLRRPTPKRNLPPSFIHPY